jgi:hypothetical protein
MPPAFEVIAERRLVRRDAKRRFVTVSLGRPRPRPGADEEWECPFQIRGAGLRRREYGIGLDAIQALTTALDLIRAILDETGLPLAWPNEHSPYTFFPRTVPFLRVALTTRLERMIDREVEKDLRSMEQRHARRQAAKARR